MIDQILSKLNAFVLIIDFEENSIIWSNRYFKLMPDMPRNTMMEYIPMIFRNIYSDQPIFKIKSNIKVVESQKSEDDTFTTLLKIKSSKQIWNWIVCKSYIREMKKGKATKIGVISIPVNISSGFKRIVDANIKANESKIPSVLTHKEHTILKDIVDGLTSKEIAEKYFISIFTVQTHRKRILKKLPVKNTAELINYALKSKLINN